MGSGSAGGAPRHRGRRRDATRRSDQSRVQASRSRDDDSGAASAGGTPIRDDSERAQSVVVIAGVALLCVYAASMALPLPTLAQLWPSASHGDSGARSSSHRGRSAHDGVADALFGDVRDIAAAARPGGAAVTRDDIAGPAPGGMAGTQAWRDAKSDAAMAAEPFLSRARLATASDALAAAEQYEMAVAALEARVEAAADEAGGDAVVAGTSAGPLSEAATRATATAALLASVLDEVGDLYGLIRRFPNALRSHARALALRTGEQIDTGDQGDASDGDDVDADGDGGGDVQGVDGASGQSGMPTIPAPRIRAPTNAADAAVSFASVATDLQRLHRFDSALLWTDRAQAVPGIQSAPGAVAILLKMEAAIHDCKGDAVTALQRFEESRRSQLQHNQLAPADATRESPEDFLLDVHMHAEYLQRVLRSQPQPPASVAAAMEKMRQGQLRTLLEYGPWVDAMQLPRTFVPGLRSQPWHSVGTSGGGASGSSQGDGAGVSMRDARRVPAGVEPYPELLPIVEALEEAHAALKSEYRDINARGLMKRETECIQDGHTGRGDWRRFSVNGFWHVSDDNGCAVATPAACALLRRLRELGVTPVLRAGYSSIGPDAWLRPHFGVTNGQLKFHLGVTVPHRRAGGDGDGGSGGGSSGELEPCATLRVGNETRAWQEGRVLFFDDSWEHEVVNSCGDDDVAADGNAEGATRVVFQVVVVHPDLRIQQSQLPAGAALASADGH